MKNKVFQIFSLAVILAFLMPAMANAQTKANFAGTWAFNASKSDMGQAPGGGGGGGGGRGGFGGGNFVAKQDAGKLTVENSRTGQDGQTTTTTSVYTLDGKESVNSTGRGESKSTATWSADGKSLTIVTTRDFNGNTMKTTEVWSLKDASTLARVTTSSTPNGEMKRTMVYDKK